MANHKDLERCTLDELCDFLRVNGDSDAYILDRATFEAVYLRFVKFYHNASEARVLLGAIADRRAHADYRNFTFEERMQLRKAASECPMITRSTMYFIPSYNDND